MLTAQAIERPFWNASPPLHRLYYSVHFQQLYFTDATFIVPITAPSVH